MKRIDRNRSDQCGADRALMLDGQRKEPPRVSVRINQKNDCECKNNGTGIDCFARTTPNGPIEAVARRKQRNDYRFLSCLEASSNADITRNTRDAKMTMEVGDQRLTEGKREKAAPAAAAQEPGRRRPGVAFARHASDRRAQASSSRRGSPEASRAGSDITWRKLRAPGNPAMMPSMWRVMLFNFRPRAPCWAICASI